MRKSSNSGRASAWRAGGTRLRARCRANSGIGCPFTVAASPVGVGAGVAAGAGAGAGATGAAGTGEVAGAGARSWAIAGRIARATRAAANHGRTAVCMGLLLVPEDGSDEQPGQGKAVSEGKDASPRFRNRRGGL